MNINENNKDQTEQLVLSYAEWMQFKEKYRNALNKNQEVFEFMGKNVYTTFAKYLIQHIESTLPPEASVLANEPENVTNN